MKKFRRQLLRFAAAFVLLASGIRAGAQDFELGVTASPSPVTIGATLTYTINVTNRSGFDLSDVFISDILPTTATFISATNEFGSVSVSSGVALFQIPSFFNNSAVFMTVNVSPTVAGTLSNVVAVLSQFADPATNILITPVNAGTADLSVRMSGPVTQILPGDTFTYAMVVSNGGPGSIAGVVLSNRLPASVGVVSTTPGGATFTNNSLIFDAGTFLNSQVKEFQVQARPTNSGVLNFSAAVSAPGNVDTNVVNDTASTNITVSEVASTNFTVSIVTTQQFNPQTGLMEQIVRLTNDGSNSINSARVIVAGLTNSTWMFNAAGTNNGQPFVIYGGTLAAGASVDLVLKFFVPSKKPIQGLTFSAVAIDAFNPPIPSGTSVPVSRTVMLPSGKLLIEFAATQGRAYTVLYSHTMSFSNAFVVQPDIIAPGNRVQWIDDGPPATISAPTNTTSRFYQILQH